MRIFISTGEVSGDLQGSLLVEALSRKAIAQGVPLEILALGGDRMEQAGATLLGNTAPIGSMGLIESIPYILPTWQVQRRAKKYLRENPPDLLILIDYFGPNAAIGSYVRKHLPKVPIVYYIAPQAWVWSLNEKSTLRLIEITDHLLAIFPEEARFYAQKGVTVTWVGHPLLDRMQHAPTREQARKTLGISSDQIIVTLLPASRQQELKYILPVICQAARLLQEQIPTVHFLIPVSLKAYHQIVAQEVQKANLRATLFLGDPLRAIAAADLAITKSGTVNLEIALLKVPQVVIYRVSPITMWLARKLLRFAIPFMSPVNLVLMKEIVPELLQEKATPATIVKESLDLLANSTRRQQILEDYQQMTEELGKVGVCDRAAAEIFNLAN